MIIWEEYRLHAIIFTIRSFLVFVYGAVRSMGYGVPRNLEFLFLYALVMVNHYMADWVTAKYGTGKSTTVRIQDKNGFFATLVLRFYSFYQFAAIGSHLTPSDLLMEMGFNTLIAIQSSAFFMTLYRKSLVGYQMHAIVYTTCLVFSSAAMARQFNLFRLALVFVAYMLRVNFGASKYMLWIAFSLTLTFQALSGL